VAVPKSEIIVKPQDLLNWNWKQKHYCDRKITCSNDPYSNWTSLRQPNWAASDPALDTMLFSAGDVINDESLDLLEHGTQ
jgi:hypothetical protein